MISEWRCLCFADNMAEELSQMDLSSTYSVTTTVMIIGEICNFVAYAFTEAILVTPLGALSVVVW